MWQSSPRERPRATLKGIPEGRAGTVETLRHMREFVRDALRSPDQRIREQALKILAPIPDRAWLPEIRALHEFVRDAIRFVRDPVDLETVATPEKTLELRAGDCDDKATLLASLLKATGHPVRFVALGFRGGPFSHVLVETKVGEHWMPLETIIDVPAGWYPKGVTSRYVLNA